MGRTRYNHTPRSPGIYYIVNTKTLKTYIGSTANIYDRFMVHKTKLSSDVYEHGNPELKADWKFYGSNAFEFIVIKECDSVEEANAGELELIRNYPNKDFLYNLDHTGKTSEARKNREFTPEHKAKISEGLKVCWAKRRQASVDEPLTCASV